jgi:hypothetical protein
MAKTS